MIICQVINIVMIKSQYDIFRYELEITQDCNAACPLCDRTKLNIPLRGNEMMSLHDIKTLIFPIAECLQQSDISLCGTKGDPILHPQCFEICEFLSDAKSLHISTNGGYNNAEWWTKLGKLFSKSDWFSVDFCIDGHEKTNHLYRQNVNWNTVIRNLEAYVSAGGRAIWVFIPFAHNEEEYEIAKEHAKRLGIRFQVKESGRNYKEVRLRKNPFVTTKPRKHDKIVELRNAENLIDKTFEKTNEAFDAYVAKDKEKLKKFASTIDCRHFQHKHLFINAHLDVSPCCYLSHPQHKYSMMKGFTDRFNFANLKLYSMQSILDKFNVIDIKQRWDPDHPGHIKKCVQQCGNKGAAMDKRVNIING